MKILIVCQYYYPENVVISNIASSFVKKGHDVTVLTGKPNYGYGKILDEYKDVKFEIIDGVKIHRVNLKARNKSRLSIIQNYLSFWRNSKRWIKKHKKEKFDIVYSMSLSPVTILAAGNLYKKYNKVPHVVHCLDLWPESVVVTHAVKRNSLIYKFLHIWSKKLYQKADKVLISSPSFEEYLRKELNLVCPIEFVPQPSLIETHEEEEKPSTFINNFNIVYCGNLGEVQLIELIPEVMNMLKENKNIKFHIIGMGPKLEYLNSKIKEYHLQDSIYYYGPMSSKNANKYLYNADLLYVSLSKEGFVGKTIPNKLMFYLTYKKPILGVLHGDGRDVLNKVNNDFVCEENPLEIKNKIIEISTFEQKEIKHIGECNISYYFSNFSLEIVSNKIISSFFEITNK